MEQQINNLLNTSGMNESSLTETEDRQLALNELTEDEVSMTIHTYVFSCFLFLFFFVFFVLLNDDKNHANSEKWGNVH